MILETGVQTTLVINCEIIFALVQKTERFRYYRPQEGRDQSLNQSQKASSLLDKSITCSIM